MYLKTWIPIVDSQSLNVIPDTGSSMLNHKNPKKIRVKFMARPEARIWLRQLPKTSPEWGLCEFIFDNEERNYDWLVVYDDLPPIKRERRSLRCEKLSCPTSNTILVTSEPSSIKSYFTEFTKQFGQVLTSQPSWALPHRKRIFQQPALQWFYGVGEKSEIDFNDLSKNVYPDKSKLISTVGSAKTENHTLHAARYKFLTEIKERLDIVDVFGRTDIKMDDKAEAIKQYRYHLAIENHISEHHWTEKLADPFLGEAVPLYIGCPNAEEYFPKESFISLNINDIDGAVKIISELTEEDYIKRLPYVLEAKRRVLNEYNLFSVLNSIISNTPTLEKDKENIIIYSRRISIKKNLISSLKHVYQKMKLRFIHKHVKLKK